MPSTSRARPAPNTASITSSARAALRRRERRGRAMPMRRGSRRVGAGARRRQRGQRDRPALLLQQPRGHVAVAAIVARPGQHQRSARAEPRANGARHRTAGIRHQRRSRHTQSWRGCVGARHLVRCQQFRPAGQRAQPILIRCHALTVRAQRADLKRQVSRQLARDLCTAGARDQQFLRLRDGLASVIGLSELRPAVFAPRRHSTDQNGKAA